MFIVKIVQNPKIYLQKSCSKAIIIDSMTLHTNFNQFTMTLQTMHTSEFLGDRYFSVCVCVLQLSLGEILGPAVQLAEEGFPVAPVTAQLWERGSQALQAPSNTHGRDLLLGGRAPRAGEIMRMPHLASTLRVSCILHWL